MLLLFLLFFFLEMLLNLILFLEDLDKLITAELINFVFLLKVTFFLL